jgi:hypothetical protein
MLILIVLPLEIDIVVGTSFYALFPFVFTSVSPEIWALPSVLS